MQKFQFKTVNVIDKDSVITYRLKYHGQPGTPIKFEKIVNTQTIRQDLDNCFKLKLLGHDEFYISLVQQLDSFNSDLAHKDSVKARQALVQFEDALQEVQNQTVKSGNEKGNEAFTTQDVYQILSGDVTSLLEQLPLP
jgi:predicted transcriptional regulator